jgi:hypothetical protein
MAVSMIRFRKKTQLAGELEVQQSAPGIAPLTGKDPEEDRNVN